MSCTPRVALNEVDTISTLQDGWFKRISHLHQIITEDAEMECATRCTARCCPQAIAIKDPDYAVGHVAIMLPFEMEFILSKTNFSLEQLQQTSIELSPGINIDIGYTTNKKPCPFLSAEYECSVHAIRPLDCRSFPLIPIFDIDGTIAFHIDTDCPSANTFSSSYQMKIIQIWEELLPVLPMSYRTLYNEL